jgi:hypothetical protein
LHRPARVALPLSQTRLARPPLFCGAMRPMVVLNYLLSTDRLKTAGGVELGLLHTQSPRPLISALRCQATSEMAKKRRGQSGRIRTSIYRAKEATKSRHRSSEPLICVSRLNGPADALGTASPLRAAWAAGASRSGETSLLSDKLSASSASAPQCHPMSSGFIRLHLPEVPAGSNQDHQSTKSVDMRL